MTFETSELLAHPLKSEYRVLQIIKQLYLIIILKDIMDVVQINQLPDTARQFSLAEECTRIIAASEVMQISYNYILVLISVSHLRLWYS